ncbi:ribose 5-phosphate isomerase B [Candidatus Palauibacter sp.]|uniref:ribose 5-phosphate isomerase B n=1 Tax=Candidatus Palauibacter sp. TaxID=3101350 RepID=UPI003AF219A1
MRLAVGADHAGVGYKDLLATELREAGHDVVDVGTHGTDSVDYPDFALAVAERVADGDAERGIVICGSAVGVCIAANKVPGVRAGVCHDTYSAAQGVDHDDMNVLCLGERVIGIALARAITDAFLGANFSAEPRHRRRLGKVLDIEARHMRGGGDR